MWSQIISSSSRTPISPSDNYCLKTIFWPCPEVVIISDTHCNWFCPQIDFLRKMNAHFLWLLNSPICELILWMWINFGVENAFCDDILVLEKWWQKEELIGALFALIFNFSKCHHKIVITKMSTQFFLATVKRPSGKALWLNITRKIPDLSG